MANGFQMTVGVHGQYEWLVCEHCLDDLLRLCPEIVLDKYIAVTSTDSGSFFPTTAQVSSGWKRQNGIAYSPSIKAIETLPREGWDEWYVFEAPADLGGMALQGANPFIATLSPGEVYAFINYNDLGLHLPDHSGIARYFWKQFDWICPQSYIGESGNYLFVISKDRMLFASALEALTRLNLSLGDSKFKYCQE